MVVLRLFATIRLLVWLMAQQTLLLLSGLQISILFHMYATVLTKKHQHRFLQILHTIQNIQLLQTAVQIRVIHLQDGQYLTQIQL